VTVPAVTVPAVTVPARYAGKKLSATRAAGVTSQATAR